VTNQEALDHFQAKAARYDEDVGYLTRMLRNSERELGVHPQVVKNAKPVPK